MARPSSCAEKLAFAYHESFGLPVVGVRYFSVYGPRQRPEMGYTIFVDRVLRGEPITVFGDGEQTRGNTYVDDCRRRDDAGCPARAAGEVYNVGGGESRARRTGSSRPSSGSPAGVEVVHGPARPGEQRTLWPTRRKARRELTWKPQHEPGGRPARADRVAAPRAMPATSVSRRCRKLRRGAPQHRDLVAVTVLGRAPLGALRVSPRLRCHLRNASSVAAWWKSRCAKKARSPSSSEGLKLQRRSRRSDGQRGRTRRLSACPRSTSSRRFANHGRLAPPARTRRSAT